MVDLIVFIVGAAGGYALAVFSWPHLRTVLIGAEGELLQLKARAAVLEAKIRAAFRGDR